MGPNNSTRTRSRTRKSTRSSKQELKKTKQSLLIRSQEVLRNSPSKPSSPSTNNDDDEFPKTDGTVFEAIDDETVSSSPILSASTVSSSSHGCSTPKGQRFRIPEIVDCPPAPKKQRVDGSNCSVRRSPIAFFAPPDLELFFYFALRGISV